jgi:methionine biosynthesis protein MetW
MKPIRPDHAVILEMVPDGARVLDLGCGDGSLLALLVERKAVQARGVEVDEANVRACVSRGLSVRHGNIEEGLADFSDAAFDVVVLSQTLAYLDHPLPVLQEMARVGRSVVVSLDNAGYWRARWRAARGDGSGAALASGEPRVRAITVPQFQAALARIGLCARESAFLRGDRRVTAWPRLRAEAAVFRLEKA